MRRIAESTRVGKKQQRLNVNVQLYTEHEIPPRKYFLDIYIYIHTYIYIFATLFMLFVSFGAICLKKGGRTLQFK